MLTQVVQDKVEELRAPETGLTQESETASAVFWMTDRNGHVVHVSPGYERIWGRACGSSGSAERWFDAVHDEDHSRVFDAVSAAKANGGFEVEYRIIRPDGGIRRIRDRVFAVFDESAGAHLMAGLAEDVTGRKKLEQDIIEGGDRELGRLGQDLHDGICQQLVSIAFATDLLRRDLIAKSPSEAMRLSRITALLDNVITQARNLSHTLCPVSLVGNGLGVALRELATSTSRGFRVVCEADCAEEVLMRDVAAATHLYRITQEAVKGAIKRAATRILISLQREEGLVSLDITDNGLETDPVGGRDSGAALNVMKHRAGMAGGMLEVRKNPFGGTIVTCHCPSKPA